MRPRFTLAIILVLGFALIILLCFLPTNSNVVTNSPQRLISNNNFSELGDLDIFIISLPSRKESHFKVLERKLKKQGLVVNHFEALNGKDLDINNYNVAPRYEQFFSQNAKDRAAGTTKTDYRGHLGCCISVLTCMESMQNMSIIFEDDACPVDDFATRLKQLITDVTELDDKWDLLVLGCSAKYSDHFYHKDNDHEPLLKGYIVKLHYWIGGWGFLFRSKELAQKILKELFIPINWHSDLTIAEAARDGRLNVYGVIPTLCAHPGTLKVSSWDYYQHGDVNLLRTDTNL